MNPITLVLFILGFVVLIIGAEILVQGASRLAIAAGISPLVIGLTVVAYGTSAPELAVAVQSSLADQEDLAVGNVVGSNIANILLILGVAAAFKALVVSQQLVRWEIPLMIGVSILVLLMGLDAQIGRLDGFILVSGAVAYTIFAVWQSRRQQKQVHREKEKSPSQPAIKSSSNLVLIQVGLIVAGLGLLVVGARWLVGGAVSIAQFLGASELIVGLTVVAVGTSLPEIATSIAATLRGERDIAVGNAVGSNIFNILLVLGMAAVIAPTGIAVSTPALRFDIPVMIAVMIACLPIFFTDYTIARWEGFLFLAYYAAYTLYLVLQATEHDALPAFSLVMLTFVVPLTGITLLVLTYRAIRTNHRLATEDRDLAEGET